MVEINDYSDVEKDDERAAERKKDQQRHDLEKLQRQQPMRTFEAKLAEKAAHEINVKEGSFYSEHEKNKTKEEKQNLLDEIIGVAKDKDDEQNHARVASVAKRAEQEYETKKEKRLDDHEFDAKKSEEKDAATNTQKKDGSTSSEGHKRVSERYDDGSGGGAGGGAGQGGQQGNGGSDSSGSHSGSQQDKNLFSQASEKAKMNRVGAVAGTFAQKGFDSRARQFKPENLDEIVSAVQLGMNEHGEEEFTVELGDDYFHGLKIKATRTDSGVVVKFVCPNPSVRGTFLKFRQQVYAHFKQKDISVQRVDVV